jgi:hypothetical protein
MEYYRTNSRFSHSGRLMSASEGGLSIYFPEQMEIGERLKLKLFRTQGSGDCQICFPSFQRGNKRENC